MNTELLIIAVLIVTNTGLAGFALWLMKKMYDRQADVMELLVCDEGDDDDDQWRDGEDRPLVPSEPRRVTPLPKN